MIYALMVAAALVVLWPAATKKGSELKPLVARRAAARRRVKKNG